MPNSNKGRREHFQECVSFPFWVEVCNSESIHYSVVVVSLMSSTKTALQSDNTIYQSRKIEEVGRLSTDHLSQVR